MLVGWIRNQKGKNDPQKYKKVKNINVWKCHLLAFEGWRLLL
jgi:hypothetical protein